MDDVERLERLNRLREAGALTDEEFQQQKAQVLAGTAKHGRTAKPLGWILAGGAVLVLMVVAILALARRDESHSPATVNAVAEGRASGNEAIADIADTAPDPQLPASTAKQPVPTS